MPYMLSSQIQQIVAQWEKYKGTTIRPAKGLILLLNGYARKLSQRKNPNLLVLGGTPELRSIGAKYPFQVFAVDRSRTMLQAMRLLCHPQPKNERMVVSDWIQIPLPKHSIDLILGDDSINMLPWKNWGALLARCAKLLKPDGLLVMQVMVEPPNNKLVDLETVTKRWKSGKIKTVGDLTKYLIYTTHNRKTYSSSFQKYLKKLKHMRNSPFYRGIWDLQKRYIYFNSAPTHPPRTLFEKLVKKHFKIVRRMFIRDFEYCRYEPVYVLKRKP